VKLLLDTHVLLWWLRDSLRLSSGARAVIADPRVTVLVSVASGWELSIKHRLGKFAEPGSAILSEAAREGFQIVPVTQKQLSALENLPCMDNHRDPFDHLLLAQALTEDAPLMTADKLMTGYGVRCVGAA